MVRSHHGSPFISLCSFAQFARHIFVSRDPGRVSVPIKVRVHVQRLRLSRLRSATSRGVQLLCGGAQTRKANTEGSLPWPCDPSVPGWSSDRRLPWSGGWGTCVAGHGTEIFDLSARNAAGGHPCGPIGDRNALGIGKDQSGGVERPGADDINALVGPGRAAWAWDVSGLSRRSTRSA